MDDNILDCNLFRRKAQPDLYCAVSQDKPVPHFITPKCWDFAGTASELMGELPVYRKDHARAGDQLVGFYLFQSPRRARRPTLMSFGKAA